MANATEKTKYLLDWLQHGYLLVQIATSGAVGQIVKGLLVTFTHIPSVWITPIWWGATAISFAGLIWIGNTVQRRREQRKHHKSPDQSTSLLARGNVSPHYVDTLYRSFGPELMKDAEDGIRAEVVKVPDETDREAFLVRFLAVTIARYVFQEIWQAIFKSQLQAMQDLNSGSQRRPDLAVYYDTAALAYPGVYQTYSFDQWIGYLRGNLLVREDGDQVSITVRGREFLKYLIQEGRSFNERYF